MGKPVAPCVGPGMVTFGASSSRRRDVVFVKGIIEALEGLAQVFAVRGGELTIASPVRPRGGARRARGRALRRARNDERHRARRRGNVTKADAHRRFDVDIAIVGGGPAGTSTALHLARAERIAPERVLLLDKAIHPREKPCAGAVSGWGLDALKGIGVPLDVPHVTMRGLRVLDGETHGASAWSDARAEGLGVVVRRSELDASLWRRAAADGVRAYDNEALVDLARVPGGWEIATTKRTVRAHLVAACDGAGSTVRKRLRLAEAARKGHLYVLETPPQDCDAGPHAGLCDFDMTPCAWGAEGYYWDFPTVIAGAPQVSRGIYHANLTPRSDVKGMLARALSARGIDIASVKLKPFSTRPFVEGSLLAIDRLVLVGEAAGIDATTGEGIAQAVLFGAIAAPLGAGDPARLRPPRGLRPRRTARARGEAFASERVARAGRLRPARRPLAEVSRPLRARPERRDAVVRRRAALVEGEGGAGSGASRGASPVALCEGRGRGRVEARRRD